MRTEAQKKADKKYRQKLQEEGAVLTWKAVLKRDEYDKIAEVLADKQISKAEFLRQALKKFTS